MEDRRAVAEEEKLKRVSWEKPVAGTNTTRRVWAVPCDCTGTDRAARTMARARIPKRYEHCDFDNFDTDIYEAGREWRGVEPQPRAGQTGRGSVCARLSGRDRNRPAADGSVRRGEDASGRGRASPDCVARAHGTFLRLPRTAQGNSGQLQPRKPVDRTGGARAGAHRGRLAAR